MTSNEAAVFIGTDFPRDDAQLRRRSKDRSPKLLTSIVSLPQRRATAALPAMDWHCVAKLLTGLSSAAATKGSQPFYEVLRLDFQQRPQPSPSNYM